MKVTKGRYKEKHPSALPADPEIVQAVKERIVDGVITCADAATIASDLQKSMREIGIVLDILEVSLTKCQLGLFGYQPAKKIISPAISVTQEMETAITRGLSDGCLPCAAAWKIAETLSLPKMNVSSACETMKIKIKPCQLGAF